jgi:hypothetical protein
MICSGDALRIISFMGHSAERITRIIKEIIINNNKPDTLGFHGIWLFIHVNMLCDIPYHFVVQPSLLVSCIAENIPHHSNAELKFGCFGIRGIGVFVPPCGNDTIVLMGNAANHFV